AYEKLIWREIRVKGVKRDQINPFSPTVVTSYVFFSFLFVASPPPPLIYCSAPDGFSSTAGQRRKYTGWIVKSTP
ncbi:hypothetical protein C8J56DRAFT_787663, partial [Mycena floridula]